MAGDWVKAIEALGAGLQGKGSEWQVAETDRKKRLDELDEKRLKMMAIDFDASLTDLNAGNVGSAWERLLDRHEKIIKLGGDPTHTENLMKMFKEGRLDEAKAKLTQARQAAIQDGLIEVPDPKSKYTGIFTTEDGQRAGLNIETNQVEVIPGGEDIRASVGGDATMASATDRVFDNGTVVRTYRDKTMEVYDPAGNLVTGDDRVRVLKAARSEQVSQAGAVSQATKLGEGAGAEANNAFNKYFEIKSGLRVYDKAIDALNRGANSGKLQSLLPSMKAATIELENLGKQLGLDVISAGKFGALSEGEMNLAMTTAMPELQPDELKVWLADKKAAQLKLANVYRDLAIYLGKPGNDLPKYLREMTAKFEDDSQGGQSETTIKGAAQGGIKFLGFE